MSGRAATPSRTSGNSKKTKNAAHTVCPYGPHFCVLFLLDRRGSLRAPPRVLFFLFSLVCVGLPPARRADARSPGSLSGGSFPNPFLVLSLCVFGVCCVIDGARAIKKNRPPHREGRILIRGTTQVPAHRAGSLSRTDIRYSGNGETRKRLIGSALLFGEDFRPSVNSGFHQTPALCALPQRCTRSRH